MPVKRSNERCWRFGSCHTPSPCVHDRGSRERARWLVEWLQKEWDRDSQGAPAMTLAVFYKSVFEMLGTFYFVAFVCLWLYPTDWKLSFWRLLYQING